MKYYFIYSISIILMLLIPVISQAEVDANINAAIKPAIKMGVEKQAGWHELNIRHEGKERYFKYFIPTKLNSSPDVVLLFHGGTQSMRKIFRKRAGGSQEWQTLAEKNGFLLLVPNGINVKTGDTKGDKQNWNDCRVAVTGNNSSSKADDVGFVSKLIDWSQLHFQTNESRIYVTGASNGGLMSLRLITELSDKITAAAVFIANQPVKTDCIKPTKPVPLFLMSATEDPLMLWQGGQIRKQGPALMSAADSLNYWLKVNRTDINNVTTEQLPDIDTSDDSVIIKRLYSGGSKSESRSASKSESKLGGQPVWFYEVRGAGHTTPSIKHDVPFLARMLVGKQNKDLEASHEAWKFLQQFSKK